MVIKRSPGRIVFEILNTVLMILLALICVIPLWHVLIASISDPGLVELHDGIIFWPLGEPSLYAYKFILRYKNLWTGYLNTIFYVIAQCAITGTLTVIAGYILSRKRFRYRNVLMGFIVFTMMFNGGMIPTYMVVRNLGLLDTYGALLIPMALMPFYIIIMRTSISRIPDSLEESARLDGAGELTILFRIVVPLSKATLAVIILFIAVAKWNEWFPALLYLPTARTKYPLQMFLRQILITSENITSAADVVDNSQLYKTLAKYGTIVVSTLPILCIYPFVQKYFVTGVMIGSIKG
ncbi:MAG TPA: carbohydrate ABC transporter permease [Candidatus Limiplasma sp.]|nr:carbohydrate ABC transporter permease [Candidatus Limiplasma sp.]